MAAATVGSGVLLPARLAAAASGVLAAVTVEPTAGAGVAVVFESEAPPLVPASGADELLQAASKFKINITEMERDNFLIIIRG